MLNKPIIALILFISISEEKIKMETCLLQEIHTTLQKKSIEVFF
jgi:hypothetical protein